MTKQKISQWKLSENKQTAWSMWMTKSCLFLLWEDGTSFLDQSQKQSWVKPKEILDFFQHSIEKALSYKEDNLLKQI